MLGQSVNSRKLFGIKDVKTFAKKNTEKVTFRMIPHDTAEKLFSFTFWDEWDEMDEQPIDNITERPISYF